MTSYRLISWKLGALKSTMKMAFCGASLLAGFLACSADSDESSQSLANAPSDAENDALDAQGSGDVQMSVMAGDAGANLGVETWELRGGDTYGLGSDRSVLAEFHVSSDGLAIESVLPERGVHDAEDSAFPALTQQYYDALALDLQEFNGTADSLDVSASVEPSAVLECYSNFGGCFAGRDAIFFATGRLCACRVAVAPTPCNLRFFPIALHC